MALVSQPGGVRVSFGVQECKKPSLSLPPTQYLAKRQDLKTVELLGLDIDEAGLRVLGNGLGFNRGVTSLKISFTPMSDEGITGMLFGASPSGGVKEQILPLSHAMLKAALPFYA